MSYLGNAPSQNAIPDLDSVAFTGDGSTTVYTLPLTAGNDASAIISIDGVRQHTTAYGINDTTLTFTAAPPSGSAIEIVILAVEALIGTPSPNTVGISQLDLSDGTSGQVLKTNGSGVLSFGDDEGLPTQTGNAGKYLTTNATVASWAALDTDANTTTKPMYEHNHTISANYTIGTGNNALTAGPITLNTGVSVTVPTGSTWVIS